MKILFTDLDGTLLNDSVKVSDYSIEVLTKFIEAGNLLVPASGRPLTSMMEVVTNAGLMPYVSYMIAYNGALIWDVSNERPLHEWRITDKQAMLIEKAAFDMGIHFQTYDKEHIITTSCDDEIKFYTKKIHLPVTYSDDPVSMLSGSACKALCIDLYDQDNLCKLKDRVESDIRLHNSTLSSSDNSYIDELSILFSSPKYLEFFNIHAGKGNAVIKLCELIGVDISDTYAAGDEENDISMLEAAGCGIAMLNATDKVKASADVITAHTNDEDGLCRFIETINS